jgi:hypothetical protein
VHGRCRDSFESGHEKNVLNKLTFKLSKSVFTDRPRVFRKEEYIF